MQNEIIPKIHDLESVINTWIFLLLKFHKIHEKCRISQVVEDRSLKAIGSSQFHLPEIEWNLEAEPDGIEALEHVEKCVSDQVDVAVCPKSIHKHV